MFISSPSKSALYGGVTERFRRNAWILWSAKCMPIRKELSYWNTASAWLDGSSYSSCAMTAVDWKARSYGVETISDVDAFACDDTTYSHPSNAASQPNRSEEMHPLVYCIANQYAHPCHARHISLQDRTEVHSTPVPANMWRLRLDM